jgi:hypothetical protein
MSSIKKEEETEKDRYIAKRSIKTQTEIVHTNNSSNEKTQHESSRHRSETEIETM